MKSGRRLNAVQRRAWLNYMRVYHRLEYEMNRQLQTDCHISLSDYTVMNALTLAVDSRAHLNVLATTIGWERSRLSHHVERMSRRGLVERRRSESDGRATDVILTTAGREAFESAAPQHAAWVGTLFFSDLDTQKQNQLADILGVVYESILRHGTLPRPDLDED
ncbi:MarR family winged helix-turn-helix transcriptional regulator [Mycolicibacterium sp. BiH015]|uniref:MarR family winged helix-turn-helix transcriptional regulator n=1 Tax=Mycolicibacterium sp. BiH015 TaxID=3018808 RepID=UPI0022E2A81D|nr:MarR family winged helix-turn-helix transcriptional regulator [Mycolicibacterium sp. BiH015]MDA2892062.1 MarR family winged helix-turn-helix transcriptional regulator [Mycolicibacterium sp. BiH015]